MKRVVVALWLCSSLALAQDGGAAAPVVDKVAEDRAAQLMEALRKEHVGAGPCYRWDRRSAVSEESIGMTALELHAKHVSSKDVAAVIPLFIQWANALEDKSHKLSEREELRKVVKAIAPAEEQAKLAKNPKALDDLADRIVTRPVDTKKAQASFDKLPKTKQTALREAFKSHAPTMRLSFVDLVVAMQQLETPAAAKKHDDGHGH